MIVTGSQSRPLQGISQQPDEVKLPGQCKHQRNMVPSAVRGLRRRPGSNFRCELPPQNVIKRYFWKTNDNEMLLVSILNAPPYLHVVTAGGYSRPVTLVDTEDQIGNYLKAGGELSFCPAADYLFVANSVVVPEMWSYRTPGYENVGLVPILYATYGRQYKVDIEGYGSFWYNAPDGTSSDHTPLIAPDYIAQKLIEAAGPHNHPEWTLYVTGATLVIRRNDGRPFQLKTWDGNAGKDMPAILHQVKDMSTLPVDVPPGYIVRVSGSGKAQEDDFWLRAEIRDGRTVWRETTQPDTQISIKRDTMPLAIIRNKVISGGQEVTSSLEVKFPVWKDKQIGGDLNNPPPSFLHTANQAGEPIRAMGVFQDRLFFLAGEAFVTSRTRHYFDLWRNSTQTSREDDPLDMYADTAATNKLISHQMQDGNLILMSSGGQFVISGDTALTSKSVMKLMTQYEYQGPVPPVSTGESVLFQYAEQGCIQLREFFADSITDTLKARPVTEHINRLIVGNRVLSMAASPNSGQLALVADGRPDRIYVYNYLWQGSEKVQSSWGWYDTGGNQREQDERDRISYLEYFKGNLYFVASRNGRFTMESISTDPTYDICLDAHDGTDAWVNPEGYATFTTPQFYWGRKLGAIVIRPGGTYEYFYPEQMEGGAYRIYVGPEHYGPDVGDFGLIYGLLYESEYDPPMPIVTDQNGAPIDQTRLSIGTFFINYDKSIDFEVVVGTKDRNRDRTYKYSSRSLYSPGNSLGSLTPRDGTFQTPVRQASSQIKYRVQSSSPVSFTIKNLSWSGQVVIRGRRL